MRIAFIIPHFGTGGAERVASLLCNFWITQGHSVCAITFEKVGAASSYPLDKSIFVHQTQTLNTHQNPLSRIATNARRISRIRSSLKAFRPDVILAFMTEANVVALWSSVGLGIPVVVSERNQPDRPGLGFWRRLARRLSYPMAAGLVVQTKSIARWAEEQFQVPIHILPNPVNRIKTEVGRHSAKRIIAVGRLVRQKGFDLLIDSFAKIAARHPDWMLEIYGEGSERPALEAQVKRCGCVERIMLPGICRHIGEVYADAGLFVLPSRFEGYPNALVEALAAGCPVIASNCPGASEQILGGGLYGMLVEPENVDALAVALDEMLSSETSRASFASQATKAVAALDTPVVGSQWLDVLSSVAGQVPGKGQNKSQS
jgi:GalNAc-alpha-(1->4)-GalNAc-alpha-(1->3)-diNAcBac-PP-undecaprenol alpha-1,4-N-acetyl-D-galactosaminyltransferase